MRVGFACAWEDPPEATWSHVPSTLLAAMQAQSDVVDIGAHVPTALRLALTALHTRRHAGEWRSDWRRSRLTAATYKALMVRPARTVDTILQIHDLATFSTPYHVYQDLSYDLLLDRWDDAAPTDQFAGFTRSDVQRRAARQRAIYDGAAGVFAMSQWFATSLREQSGVAADRIHVLHPGANAGPDPDEAARVPDRPLHDTDIRLLFVGRDFFRKGGDLVVDAVTRLRRTWRPDLQLTIIGPHDWPLAGSVPDGVRFLGSQSVQQTREAFRTHDAFVMPSRFEALGISFVEALAWGTPAIGRDAFAMPELIDHGVDGWLVGRDDDLDEAIVGVVEDHDLRHRARLAAPAMARRFAWPQVAASALAVMADPTA